MEIAYITQHSVPEANMLIKAMGEGKIVPCHVCNGKGCGWWRQPRQFWGTPDDKCDRCAGQGWLVKIVHDDPPEDEASVQGL